MILYNKNIILTIYKYYTKKNFKGLDVKGIISFDINTKNSTLILTAKYFLRKASKKCRKLLIYLKFEKGGKGKRRSKSPRKTL